MEWYGWVRAVHVFAAASWLGEVVTINLIIVPAVLRIEGEAKLAFLSEIFPRIFKAASWLSATAVATGVLLLIRLYGSHLELLVTTPRGTGLLIGLTLGTLLTAFHFVAEPKLDGMICNARDARDIVLADRVLTLLRVVPRVGLAVLGSTFVLMMYAAHGL